MKYTEHLVTSFLDSPHTGTITGADVVNRVINKETGDAVKIFLVVEDGIIKNAKFQACGSVVLFASLTAIMDLIINHSVEEARELTEKQVIKEIKQVNRCDYAMVSFAVKALNLAIASYFKKQAKLGNAEQKQKTVKVKAFSPSTLISVYEQEKRTEENTLEALLPNILSKQEEKDASIDSKEELESTEEAHEEKLEVEEDLTPVVLTPQKREIIESVPTKIEVRILDDEPQEVLILSQEEDEQVSAVTTTTTVEKQVNITATVSSVKTETVRTEAEDETTEEPEKSDDVIDEIDSITAKLTDAITKLNFKFDVDDDINE